MSTNKRILSSMLMIAVCVTLLPSVASAALTANSQLTQQIAPGMLNTDFRNTSGSAVVNPTFAMSTVTASTSGVATATGVYGDNTRRVSVDNAGAANSGWTLSLNATNPDTGTWTSGGNTYPYNGATAASGQLTVNPAAGTITGLVGGTDGVALAAQSTFSGNAPITLVTAAPASADIWNGYVTGIGLSQTIPPGQAVGNYSLSLVQTVAAS